MKIQYVQGDLFQPLLDSTQPTVLAHVCNVHGAWGAGFVVPLGKTFHQAKQEYLQWSNDQIASTHGPFRLGRTQFVIVRDAPKIIVANMVAQTLGGTRPLFYNHLAVCMEIVANHILDTNTRIVAPMFGSGLAGGNWLFIEQLIQDCWIKRNIPVTIHYLPNMLPDNWTPPNE